MSAGIHNLFLFSEYDFLNPVLNIISRIFFINFILLLLYLYSYMLSIFSAVHFKT